MPAHPWMMRAEKEIIIIWGVSQIQRFLPKIRCKCFHFFVAKILVYDKN